MASHRARQEPDPPTERAHRGPGRLAVVIPSLGSSELSRCLNAVTALDPAPDLVVVVLSGGAQAPNGAANTEVLSISERLGFAAAVNLGIQRAASTAEAIALLNDDAEPPTQWLGMLAEALADDPDLAAVQGTVTDRSGERTDGRGIALDRLYLPVQIDHGTPATLDDRGSQAILATSGTAALYRTKALLAASSGDAAPFDPTFGSYHEDLDLGLRLARLGWRAAWVGGAPTRHLGSGTGKLLGWRHPWWILANRWRALAGNLTAGAFLGVLPQAARGEIRAIRTLARHNPRSLAVSVAVLAAWPTLVAGGFRRQTPGPRLADLAGGR